MGHIETSPKAHATLQPLQIILPSSTHAEEQPNQANKTRQCEKENLQKYPSAPKTFHPIPNVHSSDIDCSRRYRPSGGKWIGVRPFCFFCFSSLPKKANAYVLVTAGEGY